MTTYQGVLTSEQQTFNEVCKFLQSPDAFAGAATNVEVIKTHAAIIFLGDEIVYKIKQPVKYDYMDFSTLSKRESVCRRELEINQRFAPKIYLGVCAVTLETDGTYAIDGDGEAVEYAVKMQRFPERNILSNIAANSQFSNSLAVKLGRHIADLHNQQSAFELTNGAKKIEGIIQELTSAFTNLSELLSKQDTDHLLAKCNAHFFKFRSNLDQRAILGMVRHCHGDLHLNNITLIDGEPTLFDALEFDEELAVIDVLYDLAFLIMDLLHQGHRSQANILLSRYALNAWPLLSKGGLKVLPLFLALRAAIRAMVSVQRAETDTSRAAEHKTSAASYLAVGLSFFTDRQPVLIALGGLSGTGKSTLARKLAPIFGPLPGSILLRSDLERKYMLGVGEFDTLQVEAYASEISKLVYDRLINKARSILKDGHAVTLDAVFLSESERGAAAELAKELGVPFCGLWLEAPEEVLLKRVNTRKNDASDAGPEIVKKQLKFLQRQPIYPHNQWNMVNAAGTPQQSLAGAKCHLSTLMPLDQT